MSPATADTRCKCCAASDNPNAAALTPEYLSEINAVIDFTAPSAVVANAEACLRAGKSLVVGTTGWYEHIPRLREKVLSANTGFLYGSNFSIGMNLFFEIAQAAAPALEPLSTPARSSSAITRRRKTHLPEPRLRYKKSCRNRVDRNWKLFRFAKAMSSVCTKWCSIRRTTGFICVTTANRAVDSPRAPSAPPSG